MFAHERAQSSSMPRQNRFPDAFIQSFCSFPIRNKISEEWVSARFSPHPGQEHIFALGAEGGTIALCSAEDLCKKRDFVKRRLTSSSRSVVFDFAFLPKLENKLLSLSGNWRLNLWDFEVGTSVHLIGHANSVRCASVCPENPYVVFSGSRDGSIFGWDLRTAPKKNFVGPQTDPIMAIYPQRTYINAHETTVDEHFPSSPRIPQSVTAKPQRNSPSITGLLHLGSNHLISASSSVSSGIRIWDLRYQTTSGPLQKLSVPQTMAKQSGITSLSWDRFKSSFFASCTDNTVHEYMPAVNTNQPVRTLRGESINSFYVQCSASPFSDHLLCGTSSKRAIIWDLQENRNYGNGGQAKISAPNYLPKPKFALGEHDAEVECVQWSHQGKYILTLSWDCLRLWSHWANKNENDEFQEEYYFEDRPFKMAFPTLLPNASVEGDEEIKKAFSTQRSEQLLTRSPLQMIGNLPAHYLDFQLGDANQWHKLQFRTPRKIIIKENASFTPACKIPRVEGHENLSASKESRSSRRNLSANFRHRQQTTPTGSGAKKRRQTPSSNKANLKGIKSSTKSPFKSPTGDSNSSSSILRYFSPS